MTEPQVLLPFQSLMLEYLLPKLFATGNPGESYIPRDISESMYISG